MSTNPYHDPNPANWWHGDEMYEGRSAQAIDAWLCWENGTVDEDGWGVHEWVEDIRRSDYLNDMDTDTLKELMYLISKNRGSKQIQNLVKYTTEYFEMTMEI